jgi:cellobiose phosphorylase
MYKEGVKMQYGFFDNDKREYVITRPDTPAPWVNYLGSPEYGAIISNNAGGYSFAKSGANGRILRYVFNQFDQPGRYLYIRDNETEDYWSASWQPVGKPLDEYKSECRHGTAYTKMLADYSGIHSEARYYVPLNKSYEVWDLILRNDSDAERNLTVTGYAEFTNDSNYEQDQVNLQYTQFITRTVFAGNRVHQMVNGNLDVVEKKMEVDDKKVTHRFFGLGGSQVDSWCGEREAFIE